MTTKPLKLFSTKVDLKNVREAAQAYVMFSRVQELQQLFIIDDLYEEKIFHNPVALDEVIRLTDHCKKNFCDIDGENIVVTSLNIRSLSKNVETVLQKERNFSSNIICLQETWLKPGPPQIEKFNLREMKFAHNSVGRGKGVAAFLGHQFVEDKSIKTEEYQMSSYFHNSLTLQVINVYVSSNSADQQFISDLLQILSPEPDIEIFIVGDFNTCFKSEHSSNFIQELESLGFTQLIVTSTHLAFRLIDHVYVKNPSCEFGIVHQSVPYLDHDVIHVVN